MPICLPENATRVFLCFPSQERQSVAEPMAYHLERYGIDAWYDRDHSLLGDDLDEATITRGIDTTSYAVVLLTEHTPQSPYQLKEIEAIRRRRDSGFTWVFPVLYEMHSDEMQDGHAWMRRLIYHDVSRSSGTREVCNHIACKVVEDIAAAINAPSLSEASQQADALGHAAASILRSYLGIDRSNLNARVATLYCAHLVLRGLSTLDGPAGRVVTKTFERLFDETRLCLEVDYRETRLLEGALRVELAALIGD